MKTENESPFSNPRFLVVLALTFVGLWGWQYYVNKIYPPVVIKNQISPTETKASSEIKPELNSVTKKAAIKQNTELNSNVPQLESYIYTDENISFTISNLGFNFTNFELKDYKNKDNNQVQFVDSESFYALKIKGQNILFNISASADKLTYTGVANIDGKELKRILTYNKEQRYFTSQVIFPEGIDDLEYVIIQDKIISKSTNFLMPSFDHQDYVYTALGKSHSERITGIKNTDVFNKTVDDTTMVSVGSQYFVAALLNKADLVPKAIHKVEGTKAFLTLSYNLKNIKASELKQIIYIGPKKTEILESIDPALPAVLNYGIFGFISKILLQLMKLIYSFVGNWGVSIIILTIVVRTLLLPFNIMSFRSAQAMQKIKPKMDEVKERFKGDPMRLNKETMALMKENNANPLSGCLPMLLQIPIFFAFFATISTSIELYHQPFFGWLTDLSSHDSLFILPILMGITMYFQQKLTPTTMDPMQAKILNFMPLIFTLFMVTLPSGLTLYNFISALFGVVQQYFLLKDSKAKNV